MAKTNSGVKGYCLNYDSNVMYPYTLLDCITNEEGTKVGRSAVLDGLINFETPGKCILGYDLSSNALVNLDNIITSEDAASMYLAGDGKFRPLGASSIVSLSVNVGNTNILTGTNGVYTLAISPGDFSHNNALLCLRTTSATAGYVNMEPSSLPFLYKYLSVNNSHLCAASPYDNDIGDARTPVYYVANLGFRAFSGNLGGNGKLIRISDGKFVTDNSSNVGTANKPVYLSNGTISASDASIGDPLNPVYMKDGEIKACANFLGTSGESFIISKMDGNRYLDVPDDQSSTSTLIYKNNAIQWEELGSITSVGITNMPNTSTDTCYVTGVRFQTESDRGFFNISTAVYTENVYFKQGTLYNTSDERLKEFTEAISINLDNLSTIKKGLFYWKDDDKKRIDIGVSAQSVEALYPQIVDEVKGVKHVAYEKLGVIALAAIDKLHAENKKLKKEIKALREKLDELLEKVEDL